MMLVLAVAALNDEDCEEALAMEEIMKGAMKGVMKEAMKGVR